MKTIFCWMMCLGLTIHVSLAQRADTSGLTIEAAENQFIKNNLNLLAQQYNIAAAKAAVLQARFLPNPNFAFQQALVGRAAPSNGEMIRPFEERTFQIQQLILLAGKRNKQVDFQVINAEMAECQFGEILRALSFQLHTTFYEMYFLQQSWEMYQSEIGVIRRLVVAYQEQYQKGNIPYKEVVRLQSFLFSLESEQQSLRIQLTEDEATLKILLADNTATYIVPVSAEADLNLRSPSSLQLSELTAIANQNRSNQKLQEASVRLEKSNLNLQRALATPDLMVSYFYDRAGSYVNHYSGLTLSVDLPVFNRNRGNIKVAENRVLASEKYKQQTGVVLDNEVLKALVQAQDSERMFRAFDPDFLNNYQRLIAGVIENYQKRNISLIEFTDFLESYKNSVIQLNTLRNARQQAFEQLNYVVGKKVI